MWNDLNEAQLRAVCAGDGPLCIVAGPGTGKTKTLTARIVHLVANGVRPEQILALTFTNKAAREMQTRVGAALQRTAAPSASNDQALSISDDPQHSAPSVRSGVQRNASGVFFETPTPDGPRITTFHGLCYELLSNGQPLKIISENDRLELLRELRSQHAAELPLRELAAKISLAKNTPGAGADPLVTSLLKKYNAALRAQNAYDFDDLLHELFSRLGSDAMLREKVQSRWRYILVDEFQDTNELQYALLKLLASHDNFFVIGDPLQSIYGFRGATGDIFKRFEDDFPNAQTITLTTNYRSTPEIVKLSNELFTDTPQLAAHTQTPGVVEAVEVLNEYREAEWIVQTIEADLGGTSFERSHKVSGAERSAKFGDYAVLYRTHRVARALKQAFEASGIPFQSVGDDSPYASKVLRTAIAALRRATFGAGALAPADNRLLAKFPQKILDELQSQTALPPTKFLEYAAATLSLIKNDAAKRELYQALSALVRFDGLAAGDFLMRFDELAEAAFFDPNADAATLMTIHASKGLEFGHVFVIAVEDGVLPHAPKEARGGESPSKAQAAPAEANGLDLAGSGAEHLAEEKRLLYVAMTRARERLTLLHARTRSGEPARLSPFIETLAPNVLPRRVDPNLKTQAIAAQKRKAKSAQASLF